MGCKKLLHYPEFRIEGCYLNTKLVILTQFFFHLFFHSSYDIYKDVQYDCTNNFYPDVTFTQKERE